MRGLKAAIVGSGNIGTDLMIKILRNSLHIDLAAMAGIDPASDGLARARSLGIEATHEGIEGLMRLACWDEIDILFDATSAAAHRRHAEVAASCGKRIIDLTPAALGPFVVPVVNGEREVDAGNLNMVTCGGQATIPIVAAVASVATVHYAEIVASIAARSAGPGTRANIDEFTETTARALESVGGAARGKAIIILNPAEPPMIMRDTIFTLSSGAEEAEIERAVRDMVERVSAYVPGYRLKQRVQFERFGSNNPVSIPGYGSFEGIKSSIFIEVEGAAHYLPAYAGNLDIMTSAALATAEQIAARAQQSRETA
jgi:acetaldehyde dehydrogenase